MARNLSPTSLATIASSGIEPVNLIEVEWIPGFRILYADRTIGEVQGRILELGNLNNVIRVDSATTAGTIQIVLSDTDGELKKIYNTHDIHKRRIIIYQWFTDIPLGERFPIFEGQIASPIVWDEGNRTLSFEVTSKVEDQEVGFAAEEGRIANLPVDLIGKPWPLVFGTAQYVPAMPLQEMPTAILLEPFGIADQGILDQIERLRNQPLTTSSADGPVLPYPTIAADVPTEEAKTMLSANLESVNSYWESLGGAMNDTAEQISDLEATYKDQLRWWPKKALKVQLDGFPLGTYLVRINDTVLRATFSKTPLDSSAKMFVQLKAQVPGAVPEWKRGVAADGSLGAEKQGFVFFNVGSTITIVSEFPIAHVVNCIPSTILGVYAYRNYGGLKKLTIVPSDNYVVSRGWIPGYVSPVSGGDLNQNPSAPQVQAAGWFSPVFIVMKRPLSVSTYMKERNEARMQQLAESMQTKDQASYIDNEESWEDQLYVTVRSSVGPNIVDIIRWIINTFTIYDVDEESFDLVRSQMLHHPANFCMFERKDVMLMLNELTTQCACSIWLKDGVFFIRYLLPEPVPTNTITVADIEHGSLQITSNATEDIVTKLVATYRRNYANESKDNRSIFRYNTGRYGIQEATMDFYAFNSRTLVKKFASFWLIRKANSWKRIVFKTFLHKLAIETLDCVTVDLGTLVANVPVKGIVESSVYNSADSTIEMAVWLPVRLGEMMPFNFAWPVVSEYAIIPETLLQSGGGGNLIEYQPGQLPDSSNSGGTSGGGGTTFTPEDEEEYVDTSVTPYTQPAAYPEDYDHAIFSDTTIGPLALAPVPEHNYNLRDRIPITLENEKLELTSSSSYPGVILSGGGDEYEVETYPLGLDQDSQTVQVKQLQIDLDENIPEGTWVMVSKIIYVENNEAKTRHVYYFMQVPVWLAEPEE